ARVYRAGLADPNPAHSTTAMAWVRAFDLAYVAWTRGRRPEQERWRGDDAERSYIDAIAPERQALSIAPPARRRDMPRSGGALAAYANLDCCADRATRHSHARRRGHCWTWRGPSVDRPLRRGRRLPQDAGRDLGAGPGRDPGQHSAPLLSVPQRDSHDTRASAGPA